MKAKLKVLISFAATAKLICVFVFAYANRWFSHEVAHIGTGFSEFHVNVCLFVQV